MLAVIRVLVIFVYFIIANALLILMCIVRPFHRNNVFVVGKVYGFMSRLIVLKIIIRVPESAKNGGPYVFIANHQNSYDLITVCSAVQRGAVSVGKKSLVFIPIFGWLYWLSGNILIDRKDSERAKDTLLNTVAKIKQGRLSVFFFPEGTRSYGRGLLPFKTGAFRIALAAKEPVVTISASNLHNKIKLNRWNNGTLLIDLSEPEPIDGSKSAKYWAKHFHEKMQLRIHQLDAEVAEIDRQEN